MSELKGIAIQKFHQLESSQSKVGEEKLREVADMYEKYFIKEMMKQMKATLPEGGVIKKNNAEKIFSDQLDDQYAGEWNKRGGFGVSDLIYDQLMDRFGVQFGLKEAPAKPQGPIELNNKSRIESIPFGTQEKPDMTFKIDPAAGAVSDSNENPKNIEIKNPWAGTLLSKKVIEGDKTSYQIKHDNGLESLILIQGGATEKTRHLSPGDQLTAGQELGQAWESSPLFWTVKKVT